MRRLGLFAILPLLLSQQVRAEAEPLLLLQKPSVSRTHVAFVYGDDLWIVPREGGDARRLTSGIGVETDPQFSPDGSLIAFTGEYDGNRDVYVVPTAGGEPKRLTYHPGPDFAVGWTPDGKSVLFRSLRDSYSRFTRLYTIPVTGGPCNEVPLPTAFEGSYSPDGSRMAYVPVAPAHAIWKRYRGGRTAAIWLAYLADSHIEKVPRENSNDTNPMWVGDHVYFLSDRNGPTTLFAYDTKSKKVSQVLANSGLDIKCASACLDCIVYEQFGSLHLLDLNSGRERELQIRVPADLPTVRPHFVDVSKYVQAAAPSPTGARVVMEARGEILTVPAEKGSARNLTNTPGVADRAPAWSPDGKSIAYFSDESGEYQLHVRPQDGRGEAKKYALGDPPSFYFRPTWSPDSKKIAYTDKRLNLWFLDLASGASTKIDTDTFDDRTLDPAWSPDSRWLAYTKQLANHLRAVFAYDLQTKKRHQITDGTSDARFAVFDKSGKYLFFTASTDIGPVLGWEMSALDRPLTRRVYLVVLRQDLPSPLAPESDEEKGPEAAKRETDAKSKDSAKPATPIVTIDLDRIGQRTLGLTIPPHNYTHLQAGKAGVLFLVEDPGPGLNLGSDAPRLVLHQFDLEKRKVEKFAEGISGFEVTHNGEKLLYRRGKNWFLVGAGKPVKPGEGKLNLDDVQVRVDPRAEWRQMYHEVWRIERDFLYDPGHHGLDLKAAEKKYTPYLAGLSSRRDLSYLFREMLGELTLGHVYVSGGDAPEVKEVKGGLLGADYRIDNNRYRFARVYEQQTWAPEQRSPLTQPGVNVRAGEYLLAVGGRELHGGDNLYSFFEATTDRPLVLRVGPNPDGQGARDVTVMPLADETELRNNAWIEDNRKKVDELSGGRLAYIYVPDTAHGGYTSFNRMFFSQLGKEGAIVDERYNSGGILPDYIVDMLRRPLIGYVSTREGRDSTVPVGGIFGPKAMIINETAGSGGDELPHYFRQAGVGPLVGKRTWGGLVGIDEYPALIDGGHVTAPSAAFWFPSGQWEVENRGVAPDIEVEFDPQAVRAGHDPQLEKAVAIVLEELRKHPLPHPPKPAYPNYHATKKNGARSAGGN
jgi:tricorn protease